MAFFLIVVLFVWVLVLTQKTGKLSNQIERLTQREAARAAQVPPVSPAAAASPATAVASPVATMPVAVDLPPLRERSAADTPQAMPSAVAATPAPATATLAPPVLAPPVLATPVPASIRPPRPPAPPSELEQVLQPVWTLVKSNPFASAGVGMVVLGLGFLLSYFAVQGLLPPALRITMVAAIGAALIVLGLRLEAERPSLGTQLQGGGLAVEYLCVLWAYQGYELIEALHAFVLLAVLSAAAFAWSFWKRRPLFATIGLLGALLAPVIASTGGGTLAGLSLYALCVSALGVASAIRLQLASISGLALVGSTILLGAASFQGIEAGGSLVFPALAYFVLFTGAAFVHQYDAGARLHAIPLAILSMAPFLALALIAAAHASDHTLGACAAIMGAVLLVSLLRSPVAMRWPIAALGSLLLLLGMLVGLEGHMRLLALIASSFALGIVAAERRHPVLQGAAWIYWIIGVADAVDQHHVTALTLAAAIAWLVGWRSRPTITSALHVAFAPLALAAALDASDIDMPSLALLALACVHTIATGLIGRRMDWRALTLSGLWIVPAWIVAAMSRDALVGHASVGRLALIIVAALLAADRVMRLAVPFVIPHEGDKQDATVAWGVSAATMLATGWQGMVSLGRLDLGWLVGRAAAAEIALIATFALAILSSRLLRARSPFHLDAMACVAVAWGAACSLWLAPGSTVESIQWISVGVMITAFGLSRVTAIAALIALVLTTLRTIAALLELDVSSTIGVVVDRAMQPYVSTLWAVVGVALVYHASRSGSRSRWIYGANALGVLVLKMVFVDLASFSIAAKVVVFVGVGLLFIVLGYLSPLPPARNEARAAT